MQFLLLTIKRNDLYQLPQPPKRLQIQLCPVALVTGSISSNFSHKATAIRLPNPQVPLLTYLTYALDLFSPKLRDVLITYTRNARWRLCFMLAMDTINTFVFHNKKGSNIFVIIQSLIEVINLVFLYHHTTSII